MFSLEKNKCLFTKQVSLESSQYNNILSNQLWQWKCWKHNRVIKTFLLLFEVQRDFLLVSKCCFFSITNAIKKIHTYELFEHSNCFFHTLPQCLKVTQNVSFEVLNFGIFHHFCPIEINMSGNTFWLTNPSLKSVKFGPP